MATNNINNMFVFYYIFFNDVEKISYKTLTSKIEYMVIVKYTLFCTKYITSCKYF